MGLVSLLMVVLNMVISSLEAIDNWMCLALDFKKSTTLSVVFPIILRFVDTLTKRELVGQRLGYYMLDIAKYLAINFFINFSTQLLYIQYTNSANFKIQIIMHKLVSTNVLINVDYHNAYHFLVLHSLHSLKIAHWTYFIILILPILTP